MSCCAEVIDGAPAGAGTPAWAPRTLTLENPAPGTVFGVFRTEQSITLTEIRMVITGGTQLTATVRFDPSRAAFGTEVNPGGTIITNMTTGQVVPLTNAAIPSGNYVRVAVATSIGNIDEIEVDFVGVPA